MERRQQKIFTMTGRFMKKIIYSCIFLLANLTATGQIAPDQTEELANLQYPNVYLARDTNPIAVIEGAVDEDLSDVMVPVPMRDRVYNKTGIQCVWATTEALGRYADEPKLLNLTEDPDCKSYANAYSFARKMKQLGVKFETTEDVNDLSLIRKAVVQERRGCLFCVPGHAMLLIHFDEQKGIVKYINNSDRTLAVRTWTMNEFKRNRRGEGWVSVIYAGNDIIPQKYAPKIPVMPIIDKNTPQKAYEKDYIIQPLKS